MADRIITCKQCGSIINLDDYKPTSSFIQRVKVERLCFDCAYWNDIADNPQPDTAIISGGLYRISNLTSYLNGNEVRSPKWTFLHDMYSYEAWACTDCKLIGIVPPRFKDRLPDRYHFIEKETYVRLKRYCRTECLSKGCWDRNFCFWYNRSKAETLGAWNEVPDGYIPGGENCESFINKYTMYDINN